jgi:hypothetical protein
MGKCKPTENPNPPKPTGGRKAREPSVLPAIMWGAKDHELVWKLLSKIKRPENHKVLFGKKKSEVLSFWCYA